MANFPNDDLFDSSKMSFGEHLEELRVSLFKAVVGLVIGFVVGLMVAHHVMNFVQRPLKLALENYYIDKAVDDISQLYKDQVNDDLRGFIRERRLLFEEVFVESSEFRRVGQLVNGEESSAPPSGKPADEAQKSKDSSPAADNVADKPATDEASSEKSDAAKPSSDKPETDKPEADKPEADKPEADKKEADKKEAKEVASDAKKKDAANGDANGSAKSADKSTEKASTTGQQESLQIIGETIPSPYSNLVKARVWKPVHMDVRALNAQEAFMIWMKAGFISGAIFASPWIFWQIWQFVAAGLYPHEKNYVYMYLPFSLLLFLAGASMAFFFVFEPVLQFLFSFNKSLNIDPDPRISEWLGFVLILPLGFGISFQLPLVMLFLNRIGLVSLELYVQKWRVAVLAIFVISAILTPADPISIFLMAVPLTLLYFLGLGLCKWMPRVKNPYAEAYEP